MESVMNNKKDWLSILNHSFEMMQELPTEPETHLVYLSQSIFDFTSYDSAMDELFGGKAIEVCEAISNRTTFDYIRDKENYKWFLLLLNTPFFSEKTEWGTSIRGAWWNTPIELKSLGLWDGEKQLVDPIKFDCDEWTRFVDAMIEFSKG